VYEWKIRAADDYKELEKLVEQIQDDGWTIEKIDMGTVSVIAYRPRKQEDRSELLNESQDEGRVEPDVPQQFTDFEWDRGDYGQQSF
jgi:hypothetical protein